MAQILDALILLVRAGMLSEELVFVIDGDELIIGLQSEQSGGIGRGDAIAVGFELDQRLGGAFDTGRDSDVVIPLRERDKTRLFFSVKEIERLLFGGAMDSAIGHLISPGQRVKVEGGQGNEGSSRKEILFNVAHISFHASFLMGRFHIAGGGVKEVVGRKIEEAGIEVDAGVESV